jgi:hypothetical protein
MIKLYCAVWSSLSSCFLSKTRELIWFILFFLRFMKCTRFRLLNAPVGIDSILFSSKLHSIACLTLLIACITSGFKIGLSLKSIKSGSKLTKASGCTNESFSLYLTANHVYNVLLRIILIPAKSSSCIDSIVV